MEPKITKYIWARKGIHLAFSLIPFAYFLLSYFQFVLLVDSLLGVAFIVEFLRYKNPRFKKFFYRKVGKLLWKNEAKGLTGATTLLIGAFICAIFLSKPVVIAVLLFLSIGDTVAYLVGQSIGKVKIFGKKTLEGGLAFLGVSIGIVFLVPDLNLLVGLTGAIIGCIVELLPWDVDDNLSIPLISGTVMEILLIII